MFFAICYKILQRIGSIGKKIMSIFWQNLNLFKEWCRKNFPHLYVMAFKIIPAALEAQIFRFIWHQIAWITVYNIIDIQYHHIYEYRANF